MASPSDPLTFRSMLASEGIVLHVKDGKLYARERVENEEIAEWIRFNRAEIIKELTHE